MRRGHPAVTGEAFGRRGVGPAILLSDPAGGREVVERRDRRQAVLVTGFEHPAVMVELGPGVFARLRLDAGPLEREAVGVEPETGEHLDVGSVAVIVVAGV